MNERIIFEKALDFDDLDQRSKYVDAACGNNVELRTRVKQLLHSHQQSHSFLEGCAVAVTADLEFFATPVGTQIGPYKLREQIGEGGMGVVYVAEQAEPVKRKVALKIIRPGMASKDVVARFEAERQALAMMDHPNIAKVHDGGATDSGQPYFVMELVRGLSITEFCDEHKLSTEDRLKLFANVCRAVQHAHQKGVIHRDLKPSNIIVSEIDGAAVPKVIDFGVAKAVSQTLTAETVYTQFSQIIGTPLYMSPEQTALGVVDIDTRSDVYSLGVLLYELLTGNTPFNSDTLKQVGFDEMRRIIREDEPPKPSAMVSTLKAEALSTISQRRSSDPRKLSESLSGELDWLVMKALEKDRNRRYESASALAADVERYLDSQPIEARPTSRWYRLRKFAKRNRVLVASAAAILTILIVGLLVSTASLLHAVRQQDIAQQRLQEISAEQADNRELIGLLSDVYPRPFLLRTPGLNRTVYEAIEDLAAEVDNGRLRKNPKVEIEVRMIFADSYFVAGKLDKFQNHLYKALSLAEQVYGPQHQIVGDIHARLAYEITAHHETLIDPVQTLKHADQAIQIYKANGIETSRTWASRAYSLRVWPERQQEAIAAAEMAIALEGEDSIWPRSDLGQILMDSGKQEHLDRALDCFNEALAIYRRRDNRKANEESNLLIKLARCLRWQGKFEESHDAYRQGMELLQTPALRREPPGHAAGLEFAEFYFAMGDVDRAFQMIDEIERIALEVKAVDSQIRCHDRRGWLYFQLGDYQSAAIALNAAVDMALAEHGPNYGLTVRSRLQLALTHQAMGHQEEAARLYLEAQPLVQQFVDASFVHSGANYISALGTLATCNGDPTLLREVERLSAKGLDHVRARYQECEVPSFYLVKARLLRQSSPENLDAAINQLYDGLAKAVEPRATLRNLRTYFVPTDRWQVESELIKYLVEADRPDEARTVLEQGIQHRLDAEGLGLQHIQTILAEIRLGEFLHSQQQHQTAVQSLTTAYEKLTPYSTVLDGIRRRIATQLIGAFNEQEDMEQAKQWQDRLEELSNQESTH